MLQATPVMECAPRATQVRPIPEEMLHDLALKTRVMSGIIAGATAPGGDIPENATCEWLYGARSYWEGLRETLAPVLSAGTVTKADARRLYREQETIHAFASFAEHELKEHAQSSAIADAYALLGPDLAHRLGAVAFLWNTTEDELATEEEMTAVGGGEIA